MPKKPKSTKPAKPKDAPAAKPEEKLEPPKLDPPEASGEEAPKPKPPAKPEVPESRKKELRGEIEAYNAKIRENCLKARETGDPEGKLKTERRKMYEFKRDLERMLRGGPPLASLVPPSDE